MKACVERAIELVQAHLAGLVLDELDQLAADALVLVSRADVEAGQLALAVLGIGVQGDTGDWVLVNLEDVIVAELLLDGRARVRLTSSSLSTERRVRLRMLRMSFFRARRICWNSLP